MHKLYKLLPSITTGDISKNIFRGGRIYLKIFLIKSKCEKLQFLRHLTSNYSLSMSNRLKYWHAQSDNLAYFLTYYVVDNNIYINCVQDHFAT